MQNLCTSPIAFSNQICQKLLAGTASNRLLQASRRSFNLCGRLNCFRNKNQIDKTQGCKHSSYQNERFLEQFHRSRKFGLKKTVDLRRNIKTAASGTSLWNMTDKDGETMPQDPVSIAEAKLLEGFCQVPALTRAWCLPPLNAGDSCQVLAQWAQRDLQHNSQRVSVHSTCLPHGQAPPFGWELREVDLVLPSPSGKKVLVVRRGDDKCSCRLEIWSGGRLTRDVAVGKKMHGSVYADNWFEGVSWSQDESRIAYIAEAGKPDPTPKWSAEGGVDGWTGKGKWQADWGETYTGKANPEIFVFNIGSSSVEKVKGLPEDLSCGQVVWAPAPEPSNGDAAPRSDTLVFTGWRHSSENFNTTKRLGIVFCFNRPSALYAVSLSEDPVCRRLTPPEVKSASSPRISPCGTSVYYLSHQSCVDSGAHFATAALHCLPWSQEWGVDTQPQPQPRVVVTVDQGQVSPEDTVFPGLYCARLVDSPFLSGGSGGSLSHRLVLQSTWRSAEAVVCVDLDSGAVERVSPPCEDQTGYANWALLSVGRDSAQEEQGGGTQVALAAVSAPNRPPALFAANTQDWDWKPVSAGSPELYSAEVEEALGTMTHRVMQVQPSVSADDGGACIEVIVQECRGQNEGPKPTVVVPHGGPHTTCIRSWTMSLAYLCALGYTVAQVNYRGSLGFGEQAAQSLPGNIGTNDVADMLDATRALVEDGTADSARLALCGGSHGGFLTAHCIGQAPDTFKTGILRNPVCNLAAMVAATDIPDWCFVEGIGRSREHSLGVVPSPDEYAKLLAVSPIAHASKVKVPTMFMLGAQDKRVPALDALQYIEILRQNGLETQVLMFPEDGHALSKVQTEYENWVTIAAWLRQHVNTPTI